MQKHSCNFSILSECRKEPAELRMGDEMEGMDACEEAKAKVEERLYRVTVIERILASKGKVSDKIFKVLEREPFVN